MTWTTLPLTPFCASVACVMTWCSAFSLGSHSFLLRKPAGAMISPGVELPPPRVFPGLQARRRAAVSSNGGSFNRYSFERVGPAHDLRDLTRDPGLPLAVVVPREDLDHLLRVVGRELHGDPPRDLLARGRLHEGPVDGGLHREREEALQDLLRARLEDELHGPAGLASGPGLRGVRTKRGDGKELEDLRLLHALAHV